jgi:aspartyl-tRNA(Asn)/glutamyl-tRNA(Gln) amidotransferase subunit C
MSKLTKDEVLHVAKLAQLNLDDAGIKKFLPQLTSVVDFISQLKEVDTEGVEPTAQVTGLTNVFRKDLVDSAKTLSSDAATGSTDKLYNGYFKVGAILSERSDK